MDSEIYKILKKYWSFSSFRDQQLDIIKSVLSGLDTLSILATGSGKSLCYQVPAMYLEGTCLVISPLIALMKDQMDSLKKRSIKAISINSSQDYRTQDILLDNVIYGNEKFLFISPERLNSRLFIERLSKMKISMVAIDEAHCISEWGHDFRPSYRNISNLKEILTDVPFIALTATANAKVQQDIIDNLKFKKYKSFISSPVRKNLNYNVIYTENRRQVILKIIEASKESNIIYVNKRLHTRELENYFLTRNIKAKAFHAGMLAKEKNQIIEDWNSDKLKLIIATNAFGMGMDKGNVRNVIHYNLPRSLEAYVQEAGRAGRDGKTSRAILLWNKHEEKELNESVRKYFPEENKIRKFYQEISNYLSIASGRQEDIWLDLDLNAFCKKFSYSKFFCINALSILRDSEYLLLSESFKHPSKLKLDDYEIKSYLSSRSISHKMQRFIKTILRTYEGILWVFKPIDEIHLGKKCDMDLDEVSSVLRKLEKMDLLVYNPGFVGHKINFKEYRIKHSDIKLSKESYANRIDRMKTQIDSLIDYIHSDDCRQIFISKYFDMEVKDKCKSCDNCEDPLGKSEIQDLINCMIDNKSTITNIVINYGKNNVKKILNTLEDMSSENLITISDNRILKYNA